MGKQVNLSKMSDAELIELRSEVEKALASFGAQKRQKALEAAQAVAKKHGFALEDLATPKKSAKTKTKTAMPPKYRHPENPEVTWSGRGRRPEWIKDAMERGQPLDQFAI